MTQPTKPEPCYLITQQQFDLLASYVTAVPTGTLPGGRLLEVWKMLDKCHKVPAELVPLLINASKNAGKTPDAPPGAAPDPPDSSNGSSGIQKDLESVGLGGGETSAQGASE